MMMIQTDYHKSTCIIHHESNDQIVYLVIQIEKLINLRITSIKNFLHYQPLVKMMVMISHYLSSSSFTGNSEPLSENRHRDSVRSSVHKQSSEHKPTRVRTVLNEKQLQVLRTTYNANPRPDALLKERLVEMTGLSPRVIRVWFQNKRCKDKKRQILQKQMAQQEKVRCLPVKSDVEICYFLSFLYLHLFFFFSFFFS